MYGAACSSTNRLGLPAGQIPVGHTSRLGADRRRKIELLPDATHHTGEATALMISVCAVFQYWCTFAIRTYARLAMGDGQVWNSAHTYKEALTAETKQSFG